MIAGLPDQHGRLQILNIHTETMRLHKKLAPDVDLAELSVQTKNFSGAEIEGLVRAAQSTAMNRLIKVTEMGLKCSAWRSIRGLCPIGSLKGYCSWPCLCDPLDSWCIFVGERFHLKYDVWSRYSPTYFCFLFVRGCMDPLLVELPWEKNKQTNKQNKQNLVFKKGWDTYNRLETINHELYFLHT